jgi:hypothetical protein
MRLRYSDTELQFGEMRIERIAREKLIMRTDTDELAVFDNGDLVDAAYRREPMRDDDGRAPLH